MRHVRRIAQYVDAQDEQAALTLDRIEGGRG